MPNYIHNKPFCNPPPDFLSVESWGEFQVNQRLDVDALLLQALILPKITLIECDLKNMQRSYEILRTDSEKNRLSLEEFVIYNNENQKLLEKSRKLLEVCREKNQTEHNFLAQCKKDLEVIKSDQAEIRQEIENLEVVNKDLKDEVTATDAEKGEWQDINILMANPVPIYLPALEFKDVLEQMQEQPPLKNPVAEPKIALKELDKVSKNPAEIGNVQVSIEPKNSMKKITKVFENHSLWKRICSIFRKIFMQIFIVWPKTLKTYFWRIIQKRATIHALGYHPH